MRRGVVAHWRGVAALCPAIRIGALRVATAFEAQTMDPHGLALL